MDEVDTICGINLSLDDATLTKSCEMCVELTAMACKLGGCSALLADKWEVVLVGHWPKSKLRVLAHELESMLFRYSIGQWTHN